MGLYQPQPAYPSSLWSGPKKFLRTLLGGGGLRLQGLWTLAQLHQRTQLHHGPVLVADWR